MATTKVSITLDDADLAWLRRRSRRGHGGNLSAVVTEAARALRRQEALRDFLDAEGVPNLTASERAKIVGEWRFARERSKRRTAA